MKKWKTAIILAILFCLIPCCAALAKTGKVTATSLNIRKSANSESKVVGTLHEGAKVTIQDSTGSWYKIKSGSKSGYVYKKYIKIVDSSGDSSDSKKSDNKKSDSKKNDSKKSKGNSDGTCSPGDCGENVKKSRDG